MEGKFNRVVRSNLHRLRHPPYDGCMRNGFAQFDYQVSMRRFAGTGRLADDWLRCSNRGQDGNVVEPIQNIVAFV